MTGSRIITVALGLLLITVGAVLYSRSSSSRYDFGGPSSRLDAMRADHAYLDALARRADDVGVAGYEAQLVLADLRSTIRSLQQGRALAERWETKVLPLLEDEKGRKLASNPASFQEFFELYIQQRLTTQELQDIETRVGELAPPLLDALEKDKAAYIPSQALRDRVATEKEKGQTAVRFYELANIKMDEVLARAGTHPPTAEMTSLRAAIQRALEQLERAKAEKKKEELADADQFPAPFRGEWHGVFESVKGWQGDIQVKLDGSNSRFKSFAEPPCSGALKKHAVSSEGVVLQSIVEQGPCAAARFQFWVERAGELRVALFSRSDKSRDFDELSGNGVLVPGVLTLENAAQRRAERKAIGARSRADFLGTWKGSGAQPGGTPFSITLHIDQEKIVAEFPSLNCFNGSLVVESAAKDVLNTRHEGANSCARAAARIRLTRRLTDDGPVLDYTSWYPNGNFNAQGTVRIASAQGSQPRAPQQAAARIERPLIQASKQDTASAPPRMCAGFTPPVQKADGQFYCGDIPVKKTW